MDECRMELFDTIREGTYLHLKHISPAFHGKHQVLQHSALIESEAAGEVRHGGIQQECSEKIGAAAGQHAFEIPASHL